MATQPYDEDNYTAGEEIVTKENLNYNVILFRQLSTIQYYLNNGSYKLAESSLRTLEALLKPYLPKDYRDKISIMKVRQLSRIRLVRFTERDAVARKLDEDFKFEILGYFVECANEKGFLLDREVIEEI